MANEIDKQAYRVIMDGYFLAETSKSQVIKKLKRLFGVSEEKILNMFDGQPTIIKNQLPKNKAYQYLRTITNAGAACHMDKLVMSGPEETTQLPVHVERTSEIADFDPLGKIKKRIQERNDFSEVMRHELLELDLVRKKSDQIMTMLFVVIVALVLLSAIYFLFF